MKRSEGERVGSSLRLLRKGIEEQDEKRWGEEQRVHSQIRGKSEGEQERKASSLACFGDGGQYEEIRERRCRASDTSRNREGIEEEAIWYQLGNIRWYVVSYPAATAKLLHLKSFLEDLNRRVTEAWPLSAI
jgi:hypothetical protein